MKYRVITHLRNLARGAALTRGRNYVTVGDIPLIIKVVLSTASMERVRLLDLLLIAGGQLSTSITFHVTATQGTNPIAGFQCSLDGSSFSSCATTNPATITYNNLAAGQQHTFTVRAVDTQGNVDPTPATFRWTVLTPKQAVQNLDDTIDNMHLPRGTTTSLEATLNAAIRQLNHNNDVAACNNLAAFLHQVNADEGSGRITSQQAIDLRQQVTALQHALGCFSLSTSVGTTTPGNTGNGGDGDEEGIVGSVINPTMSGINSMQSKIFGNENFFGIGSSNNNDGDGDNSNR